MLRLAYFGILLVVASSVPASALPANKDAYKFAESEPSSATVKLFSELFENATSIEIRFTPFYAMGRAPMEAAAALKNPRFQFTINCPNRSCGHRAIAIRKLLTSGRRVFGQCQLPITTVISFVRERSYLRHVYVSPETGCFSLDGMSYLSADRNALDRALLDAAENVFGDKSYSR